MEGAVERALCRRNSTAESLALVPLAGIAQPLDDATGEVILDLAVARDRLTHVRARILIPIVFPAVSDENTTHLGKLLDQVGALHATWSCATSVRSTIRR